MLYGTFKYVVIIYIETACYGFLFEKNCEILRKIWQYEIKNYLFSFGTGPLQKQGNKTQHTS